MPVKKEIIEDVCSDCKNDYCTLKEVVAHSGMSDRALEQLKCIEIFKWNESYKERADIGWTEAHKRWIDSGNAEKFAAVYKDGMKSKELHEKLFGITRNE